MAKVSHVQTRPASISPNHALWRNHPATPTQLNLYEQAQPPRKPPLRDGTQAAIILGLLLTARANNTALDLTTILSMRIGQYSARIKELRERGYGIRNEMTRTAQGVVISRYWLVYDPERDGVQP